MKTFQSKLHFLHVLIFWNRDIIPLMLCCCVVLFVIFSACPADTFGVNCSHRCRCSADRELCHPVTGKCSCGPGYYGPRCELRESAVHVTVSSDANKRLLYLFTGLSAGCRAGTFGPNCRSRCSCLNGGRCDFRTGTCHCPPGFIGADCGSGESGIH